MIALLTTAVTAVPSPAPATGMTPEQMQQLLMDALSVAKTIPWPAVGAIFVALIVVCAAVLQIAAFFRGEAQRRAEAYAEAIRIRQQQLEITEKVQRDASQALKDNMDAAYQDDYRYYIKQLTAKNYPAIWGKIPLKAMDAVGKIVYSEDIAPEDRAARIILVLKQLA